MDNDPEFQQFPPHCVNGTPGAEFVSEALAEKVVRVENSPAAKLPDDLTTYQQIVLEKQTLDIFQTQHAPGNLEINHDPRNGRSYFNTSLFSIGPLGSPGTSPRRFFYGPGMDNWDMALLKLTHITESKVLEMRLETFNTFNHAQFFGPTSVNANISSTSFGQVVSAMPSRVMQVAAKFNF